MIVAVTGHRPNKLGGYRIPNPTFNSVMEGLDKAFLELNPERVITGMALGVDQWAAELCLWNGIPYVAAIPFEGFDGRWPERSRIKYRELLSGASRVEVVCNGFYEPWKMQRRNEWMVDHCNLLIAVWDGTDGGTANCLNYARQARKQIHYVPFRGTPPVAPQEIPRRVEIRPAETIRSLPIQERRIPPQESEGMRAARRRARRELIEADPEFLNPATIERFRDETEETLAESLRQGLERFVGMTIVQETETKKEEPVVRDFARFVDLDE